jgi:asparagine synthase (glutamine-hydrolysing)
MCGISGIIKDKKSNTPGLENQIKKMTVSLKHRGPDNSGIWIDNDNSIALGHQRLSILDLSAAGNQPMEFSECKFVISFNGEIYNHLEIRKEIERDSKKIINWISNTDTETLIRAFEIWGTKETLKKCSGMFSIALWDKSRKILTLARDRFGEKPLYFGWVNKNFVFASELKAIKKIESFHNPICKKALSQYLSVNYVPSPLSIYENIFKLEPGTFVEIDNSIRSIDQIKIHKYWSIHNIIQKVGSKKINHQNMSINELENVLFNSVKSQMLSDVPLGAFLSGGVDSSLIVP